MPHATENLTNGETHSSKFIKHVTSYPVVKDSVDSFKANPYGRKSIDLGNSAYQRFGKPVEPYLETPLAYAKPYAERADALADSGLDQVDARFPIVKENTDKVIETGKSYIFYPLKLAFDGKDYLFKTWNDEYTKTAQHNSRGPGLTTSALALISTELKIASDFFLVVSDYLGPKYDETKKKGADYIRSANDALHSHAKTGEAKLNEAQKVGEEKVHQAKKEGEKIKEDVKAKASK